jgi:hypothetical protein
MTAVMERRSEGLKDFFPANWLVNAPRVPQLIIEHPGKNRHQRRMEAATNSSVERAKRISEPPKNEPYRAFFYVLLNGEPMAIPASAYPHFLRTAEAPVNRITRRQYNRAVR